jgi:hypothetical protein
MPRGCASNDLAPTAIIGVPMSAAAMAGIAKPDINVVH